jgi:carbon monoxide dehydrogenase subunit G
MRLVNEFVVPRPIDEAWAVLTDVERIAPCMPGAQLGEVVDDNYHGTVKVRVGPVVAQYAGVARFRELDAVAHHMVLEANGKQTGGNGRAAAVVTADLTAEDDGTRVTVNTDLTISGPLAQFGRGAITEVSGKLLGQFVDRLKETVLAEEASSPTTAEAPVHAPTPAVPSAAAVGTEAAPAPEAAPANLDLMRLAGLPILKRLVPVLIVVVIAVVLLIIWLG